MNTYFSDVVLAKLSFFNLILTIIYVKYLI